jgi:hypothetical protein
MRVAIHLLGKQGQYMLVQQALWRCSHALRAWTG